MDNWVRRQSTSAVFGEAGGDVQVAKGAVGRGEVDGHAGSRRRSTLEQRKLKLGFQSGG
jgi:hypothetical protein